MSGLRKVSVAILSWNGRSHLEVCLPALRRQLPPACEWETLLLDNGSTDGTGDWVRQHHPEVRLITSPVNLGFCSGNNRLAREAEGDAIVFLNNDTRPHEDWLGALTEALATAPTDVAAVSGQIIDWSGDRLDFARGVLTFDGHAFQMDYGRRLGEVEVPASGSEMLFACGGNMIVRRESFLAAGGFDDDYFAYLEDVDLGWRLWSGGERVIFEPAAVVHHRSMATSRLLGNENRGFLFERNAFLTAYKNYDAEHWQKMAPLVLLTLAHRTQTLMVRNNPGGEQLAVDPYAGLIADTAASEGGSAEPPVIQTTLSQKWRGYGPREFVRRGLRKAMHRMLPDRREKESAADPCLNDAQTLAQLRAVNHLLENLDPATKKREVVQARRQRPDREIFERFPPYLVPTYPGDDRLFSSLAFETWLPDEPAIIRASLDEIMRMGS